MDEQREGTAVIMRAGVGESYQEERLNDSDHEAGTEKESPNRRS